MRITILTTDVWYAGNGVLTHADCLLTMPVPCSYYIALPSQLCLHMQSLCPILLVCFIFTVSLPATIVCYMEALFQVKLHSPNAGKISESIRNIRVTSAGICMLQCAGC